MPEKSKRPSRAPEIRKFLLSRAETAGNELAKEAAIKFEISRQAANKYISQLVQEQLLKPSGQTRARQYSLRRESRLLVSVPLRPKPQEDVVWREKLLGVFAHLPQNVVDIWHYGFTEILNNAIDHSGGSQAKIRLTESAIHSALIVSDDGEGIFNKIQRELGLYDARQALLELAKGKLTTDPKNHTGEGIFFTSRALDEFYILSGDLFFSHAADEPKDWLSETDRPSRGTAVFMTLAKDSTRDLAAIFNEYASTETDAGFRFDKTVVPVRLAKHEGEALVSRSQAKRLIARFENFRSVLLDFSGVQMIGQGFADEVFRVFVQAHPEVELLPINAGEQVMRMIFRAKGLLPAAGDDRQLDLLGND